MQNAHVRHWLALHRTSQLSDRVLARLALATSGPDETGPTTPPVPPLKKRRGVEAKAFWSGGFLETQEDVDAYLSKLRAELESGLEAGHRIQIK